jgi:hypothetical protein
MTGVANQSQEWRTAVVPTRIVGLIHEVMMETTEIEIHHDNMNMDDCSSLCKFWKPLIHTLKECKAPSKDKSSLDFPLPLDLRKILL